jgi:multiple sugar transport system ATP-binding protein
MRRELYRRPANRFVAAFIGSPAMNLIKARLVPIPEGSRHGAEFGSHRLVLPERIFDDNPRLAQYLGRVVVLGVRPEDLEDASLVAHPDPQAIIELTVDLLEDLGAEVDVHCSGDLMQDTSDIVGEAADGGADELARKGRAGTVVARMNRHTKLGVGDTARIRVDVSELHFFDDDTGETIAD